MLSKSEIVLKNAVHVKLESFRRVLVASRWQQHVLGELREDLVREVFDKVADGLLEFRSYLRDNGPPVVVQEKIQGAGERVVAVEQIVQFHVNVAYLKVHVNVVHALMSLAGILVKVAFHLEGDDDVDVREVRVSHTVSNNRHQHYPAVQMVPHDHVQPWDVQFKFHPVLVQVEPDEERLVSPESFESINYFVRDEKYEIKLTRSLFHLLESFRNNISSPEDGDVVVLGVNVNRTGSLIDLDFVQSKWLAGRYSKGGNTISQIRFQQLDALFHAVGQMRIAPATYLQKWRCKTT